MRLLLLTLLLGSLKNLPCHTSYKTQNKQETEVTWSKFSRISVLMSVGDCIKGLKLLGLYLDPEKMKYGEGG